MKQKVHSVSYLAKAEFELKDGSYDLVALPTGAEMIRMSLQVVGSPKAGTIKVTLKDEITDNPLTLLSDLLVANNTTTTVEYCYTVPSNKVLMVEVMGANEPNIKGVLKVIYFLPSVIEVEY
ncbi:hypothetical protein VN0561_08630 [Helicobacter pylori]